jgi:hypothetical protein
MRGRKRCLVEIFAVKFLEKEHALGIDQILEENLVLTTTTNNVYSSHVLCDISGDKQMEINSGGYLVLTGPHHGIEIEDYFSMRPFYDSNCDITTSKMLWESTIGVSDIFMGDWSETVNGFIIVKFAVYQDGLEAQLEVTISDLELVGMPGVKMPLEVYGTVRTSNTAVPHSEAKSYLFDHIGNDNCVILALAPYAKAEIPLPLSRRVTVIPRESTLIVDVNLSLRCDSGDISIANESVSFHSGTRSNSTIEEQIIKCGHAKVKVKVTWIEAVGDNRVGQEAEEEVTEDEEAISEEFDREGDQGAESEYISDDDRSFGSLKLRRLNSDENVSTRFACILIHSSFLFQLTQVKIKLHDLFFLELSSSIAIQLRIDNSFHGQDSIISFII